ncbi:60S ribosomal protein L29 [Cyanidioschyzon merolae strain 10D]|uniref:60S ribosomal protein L29 n=1 Tax=Cyanidioschyzon merolae (strain NIES-3377 / 10D) TaxID=280699 RepID=M1UPC6_CYAM1|nr:60S ribosomal protein L29 [Cyanidioschyzon merolae strain 10D]BAM79276.1 60S ribosomal protein L29 [Cyanidioschyzon merolae strain 10D]|eukprot:XP_005535562.1 60S ribosomal protein L29 [Cyanidioschyzon merolae strain 10D]
MAKSKNHTNHNQSRKAHRNGIKRPRSHRYASTKGMYQKFLRNQRFARKGSVLALKLARRQARRAAEQKMETV